MIVEVTIADIVGALNATSRVDLARNIGSAVKINGRFEIRKGPIRVNLTTPPTADGTLSLDMEIPGGFGLFGIARTVAAKLILNATKSLAPRVNVYKAKDGNLRVNVIGVSIASSVFEGDNWKVQLAFP